MNIRQCTETITARTEDLLADADNLVSAALGIASGSQGYCIFISARDDFRQKLILALNETPDNDASRT